MVSGEELSQERKEVPGVRGRPEADARRGSRMEEGGKMTEMVESQVTGR